MKTYPSIASLETKPSILRTEKTQNAQAISALVSQGRILLTGTPIENNVYDLISLLEFLLQGSRPEIQAVLVEKREFGTNKEF